MASAEAKRRHVLTKRMQEYLETKQQPIASGDLATSGGHRLLHCPQVGCDKVLTSTPGLRYHMRTHDIHARDFLCFRCRKQFKSHNGLRYHLQKSKCEYSFLDAVYDQQDAEMNGTYSDDESLDVPEFPASSPSKSALRQRSMSESSASHPHFNSELHVDVETVPDESGSWLHQLAIIATGPQSPLLETGRDTNKYRTLSGPTYSENLHTYARPPRSSSLSPPPKLSKPDSEETKASSILPKFSSLNLSPKPTEGFSPQWLCFNTGSRVRFQGGEDTSWHRVEELSSLPHFLNGYGDGGLRVCSIEECPVFSEACSPASHVRLNFSTDIPDQVSLTAETPANHPFFVKNRGWCSVRPLQSQDVYSQKFGVLQVNDICLPSFHPTPLPVSPVTHHPRKRSNTITHPIHSDDKIDLKPTNNGLQMSGLEFTDMDSSAALALSSMAKQKKELQNTMKPKSTAKNHLHKAQCNMQPAQSMSQQSLLHSPPQSPTRQNEKGKRPMNAFMLFARKFRMEYMQLYPGKDNRTISVLLGEHWKRLSAEERRSYASEAKQLADDYKRINPDCWKRKRSVSTGALER